MAMLFNNGVYERLVTPSAVARTRHAGVEGPWVHAACDAAGAGAAILKASPKGLCLLRNGVQRRRAVSVGLWPRG
jgi:hypothetical protein